MEMPVSGGTLDKLSGPLVHTYTPKNRARGIGPYNFPLKITWTNGSQIPLIVLVYTGVGSQSALLWYA